MLILIWHGSEWVNLSTMLRNFGVNVWCFTVKGCFLMHKGCLVSVYLDIVEYKGCLVLVVGYWYFGSAFATGSGSYYIFCWVNIDYEMGVLKIDVTMVWYLDYNQLMLVIVFMGITSESCIFVRRQSHLVSCSFPFFTVPCLECWWKIMVIRMMLFYFSCHLICNISRYCRALLFLAMFPKHVLGMSFERTYVGLFI